MRIFLFCAEILCFILYEKNKIIAFLLLPLCALNLYLEYRKQIKTNSKNLLQIARLGLLTFMAFLLLLNYFFNVF